MRSKRPKILVTGGAGFIGSEFIRQAVKKKQRIVVVDSLNYAGDLERLKSVKAKAKFYKTDIADAKKVDNIFRKERPQIVAHFASETHVDRSILDSSAFIRTNVTGTQNLILSSLRHKLKKFIHISTDEVYGQIISGKFREADAIRPRNPYAATKAAAEHLIKAAEQSCGLRAVIIRPSNIYGPWQYPEKFIPMIIAKALYDERVFIYGRGRQVREWLYVADCAKAIHFIMRRGKVGEAYNLGSNFEQPNLTTAKAVLKKLGKPQSLIRFVKDRPGHDFRYSSSCTKLKKLGWQPKTSFNEGLDKTLNWYCDHTKWVDKKRKKLNEYWGKVYKI